MAAGLAVGAILLFAAQSAAAVNYVGVSVRVEVPDGTLIDSTYYISDEGCSITDSAGVERDVAGASALCALQAAAGERSLALDISYFDGFGMFVNGIGEYVGDGSNFWTYFVDYTSPAVGLADFQLKDGSELLLTYGADAGPVQMNVLRRQVLAGDPVEIAVTTGGYAFDAATGQYTWQEGPAAGAMVTVRTATIDQRVVTGSDGVAKVLLPQGLYGIQADVDGYTRSSWLPVLVYERQKAYFSLGRPVRGLLKKSGVAYLYSQIDDAGLVQGSVGTTEWAAIALGGVGKADARLKKAVLAYDPAVEAGTTELARHILALEAIGFDGNYYNGTNYLDRMKETRVDFQYGSVAYCNDDIFAALAMLAADEPYNTEALNQAIAQSLNCVNEDGGVGFAVDGGSDVDTTAAWLMLAGRLQGHESEHGFDLETVRSAALQYLADAQNYDGGWGYLPGMASNSSSTAWVLMGLRAQGGKANAAQKNYLHGFHFLASVVNVDGGVGYDSFGSASVEVLNTAYALMALGGKPLPVNVYMRSDAKKSISVVKKKTKKAKQGKKAKKKGKKKGKKK